MANKNSTSEIMLEAISLSKQYKGGPLALDRLSLKISRGEVYCLLGANGAGKTTTINLFLGFTVPTSGQAFINGIDVQKEPLEAKRFVSYVSENVVLYRYLTARQNLNYFARLAGRTNMSRRDYYEVLSKVGLTQDAYEQRVGSFSKGMRQKLGIAVAIISGAPAILMDEPTSGLDPKAASEFIELMHEVKNRRTAILMSTHDIFRVKQLASKVGIMKEGRLVAEKTREEFLQEDLETLYLDYMSGVGGLRAEDQM